MACLGKVDVDSDEFKVTHKTSEVLVVVLGNSSTTIGYNHRVCTEIFHLVTKTSPYAKIEFLAVGV